ncbi:MAG: ribosome maturation factor RimP [Alphaproteobacteria bacterium]|nr:ribosome maturation factor RimP [Alphaproteobacteria bacterium]
MAQSTQERVEALVAADIDAAGYDLVRVRLTGGAKHAALQIMIERKDGALITVDDCASVSRLVETRLTEAGDRAAEASLEVSSPGIDRPLVKARDYARFKGQLAKVELKRPCEGPYRFQGVIRTVGEKAVVFDVEGEEREIPLESIEGAQLVLTDSLLNAAAQKL